MNSTDDPVLEELRAATACPTWVLANFTLEKIHTNLLVAALNKGDRAAARQLSAALWNLASGDAIDPTEITGVAATPEVRLKQGPQGIIDLHIDIDIGGSHRQLAVEVKVDSPPWSGQLVSMSEALGGGSDRRLVLLCLGAARTSRVESEAPKSPEITRWSIAHLLGIREFLVAAAPVKSDAEAWLAELEREEKRRLHAWMKVSEPTQYGYRGDLLITYRYGEAVNDLAASGSEWEVSLQRFGVILHAKSSRWEIPGTTVTLYLEVAGGTLRVKSGAWYDASDALAAAEPLRSRIEEAFTAHGFAVKMGKRKHGESVTLMLLDPDADAWPREAFVDRLRRAHTVWSEFVRPPP